MELKILQQEVYPQVLGKGKEGHKAFITIFIIIRIMKAVSFTEEVRPNGLDVKKKRKSRHYI